MLQNIYLSLQLQLLHFVRNKNALFWALTFPLFIYMVFYTIFGTFNGGDYALFLLTGVLGMTLTSDGLFGVGAIIKLNYQNGTIRLLKKMPINIISYFAGMILNRFLILIVLLLCLNAACFFLSGKVLSLKLIPNILLGVLVGLWIFSFIGLSLSFLNIKGNSEKSITNIAYFLILFTSNALYDLKALNPMLEKFANILPLNGVLHILRGEPYSVVEITVWMLLPVIVFYYLFNKVQYSR